MERRRTMGRRKIDDRVAEVAERIRTKIQSWGITVSFLASRLGVSRQYGWQIVHYRTAMSYERACEIESVIDRIIAEKSHMNTFGERLRAARRSAGLTLKEAARLIGYSWVGVERWERDLCMPKPGVLWHLLSLYGVAGNRAVALAYPTTPGVSGSIERSVGALDDSHRQMRRGLPLDVPPTRKRPGIARWCHRLRRTSVERAAEHCATGNHAARADPARTVPPSSSHRLRRFISKGQAEAEPVKEKPHNQLPVGIRLRHHRLKSRTGVRGEGVQDHRCPQKRRSPGGPAGPKRDPHPEPADDGCSRTDHRQSDQHRRQDRPDPRDREQKKHIPIQKRRRPVQDHLEPDVVRNVPDAEGHQKVAEPFPRARARDHSHGHQHHDRGHFPAELQAKMRDLHQAQRKGKTLGVVETAQIHDDA